MKRIFSFITIILSICSFTSLNPTMKCERTGPQNNNINVDIDNDFKEEITSTVDYLEFNNKQIEKVLVPDNDEEKLNVDNDGNIYFQKGEKLFIRKHGSKNATEVAGIVLLAQRTNEILIDTIFNYTFVGIHNGLFVLRCGGTRAAKLYVTDNIAVDFGIIDSYGNIYFGTDGSNTARNEQLYVFERKTNSLVKINGIETSLGSYPIESRGNRNKIAIDSKNNVYVGAYSNYVYLIRPGDTDATRIKDNRDNGGVTAIVVDSKDNVYCRTYTDLHIYKNSTFIKILETIDYYDLFLSVDHNDDVHFKIAGEEYVLKPKEISAFEVTGILGDKHIILNKNLMVRNNIFYFTTRGNGEETLCSIKQGETNASEIRNVAEYYSVAVDNDNNIYFTATSSKIPNKIVPYVLRSNAKMPIEIRGVTSRLSSAYVDNKNNVYFSASNGLHVLNFDEVIPHRLRATGSFISSVVIAKYDNVYFGTDYDGAFVLKSGESEATKINGITEEFGPLGPWAIETFADKNFDVVYFQTSDGTLYKLMSGDTVVSGVVKNVTFQFYLSDCRNNTYYVNQNDVYLIESGKSMANKIAQVYGQVLSIDIDSSNRMYFATTIGLQVLNLNADLNSPITASLLTNTMVVNSFAIDKGDNIYFGTDDGAFVLRSGEMEAIKINGINEGVVKIIINLYDIYFITTMGSKLFILQNKLELSKLFKKRNLGEIDNNEDETILNTLNYVNIENDYILNRSKNKVVNKTETSAIIVGIKGKYFGEFKVEYTIRHRDTNDMKYFVDIDFLKKAIFFNYINENLFHYKKMKDIKEIEVYIDNLRFDPVEVLKDTSLNSSFEFRNVCDMKKVANSSPVNQVIKFPECNYKGKETISFEITTGIKKPFDEPFKSVLSSDDEVIISDYLYNNKSNSEPVPLSNTFELSNSNFFTKETVLYSFFEPEQDIVVPPKQQILVKYSVRTFVNKINLKLIQKVYGVIVSKVVDKSDEQIIQITLRNAMQVLEKYSQLPVEVTINDDNSVTFSGKATLISQRESMPIVIRNFD